MSELSYRADQLDMTVHAMAGDGQFIYLNTDLGMLKVGSGYGGTVRGHVYKHKPDFRQRADWMGVIAEKLYFKAEEASATSASSSLTLKSVNVEELAFNEDEVINIEDVSNSFALFTDGLELGLISSLNSDNFTVKMYDPNECSAKSEMILKLAKKKVEVYGQSSVSVDLEETAVAERRPDDYDFRNCKGQVVAFRIKRAGI